MGAFSFTLDPNLVKELQRLLPLTHFVETGTFKGETLAAVHPFFEQCLSVELSPTYYAAAKARFAQVGNISMVQGDSAAALAQNHGFFATHPTLFWLDAHWCSASNTAGEKSQCPLLAEITAIGTLNPQSIILIDDARLFTSPPPKPHDISNWPDLDDILSQLKQAGPHHQVVIYNDVIIFVPATILPSLRMHLQETTINLLTLADQARAYDQLLLDSKGKETEINNLAEAAHERLELVVHLSSEIKHKQHRIFQLEQAMPEHKDHSELAAEFKRLSNEFEALRIELRTTQAELTQLEHYLALRPVLTKSNSVSAKLAAKLGRYLAQHTRFTFPELVQYSARPLLPERFPRPRKSRSIPRICIITPSYQQAAYLERTILSVLDQNYPDLAYGVQDGGSTDGSVAIIERYLNRLRHAESAPDQGQAAAIERGFAKLYPEAGNIMAWLNSDDVLMPGALRFVGEYFASHPEVDVIYGHRVIIDADDNEVGRWFLPPHTPDTAAFFDLVPQETLFWRAEALARVGGIDPAYQFALDWDLLLRFRATGLNIKRLPYFLGCFRVHESQKTQLHINTVGDKEMQKLRRLTHGRDISPTEIQAELNREIGRSAMTAWLHGLGIRY